MASRGRGRLSRVWSMDNHSGAQLPQRSEADGTQRRQHLISRLELSATVLLIIVTLLVGSLTIWDRLSPTEAAAQGPTPPPVTPPPAEPVSIDGAPTLGDKGAKVALITFTDFECPYCGRSARETLPELERQYLRTGKVLFVLRNYPLPIHKNAQKAAEAAECAGSQGRFWEFHDWAFRHQTELDEANLGVAAKTLNLNLATFRACLDGQMTERVKGEVKAADGFSIAATPTWFIGVVQPDGKVKVTERIQGAKPLAEFQRALDRTIAIADGARR